MKSPDEIKKGLECHTELDPDECSGVCPYSDNMFGCIPRLCDHALALIQQLQAENAEKDARIQQLEAERDAAVKDMHRSCFICKNFGRSECLNTVCNKCVGWCNWEWRGVQKEE